MGYGRVHVQENDTGPDDCNHAQYGAFVLAGNGVPEGGWIEGAHLLDMAPTLLARAGYDIPSSMQGRDLMSSNGLLPVAEPDAAEPSEPVPFEGEAIIRERLRGLGYLS